MRVSMDCKATVNIGDYSRGGQTRGDNQAADHDMGCEEKHTPFGVVDEDSGRLHLSFGSSAKTSDFIIDSLYAWWESQASEECARVTHIQIKADNGPESNGRRTQFLKRIVEFADHIGKSRSSRGRSHPVALSHHRTCGSAYGGSSNLLEASLSSQQRNQPQCVKEAFGIGRVHMARTGVPPGATSVACRFPCSRPVQPLRV
jgi:hypothetical protein